MSTTPTLDSEAVEIDVFRITKKHFGMRNDLIDEFADHYLPSPDLSFPVSRNFAQINVVLDLFAGTASLMKLGCSMQHSADEKQQISSTVNFLELGFSGLYHQCE
jgi:hypothetical protein